MSLLISVSLKHFIVVVSDGLKVRVENGALVKADENSRKYWTVGNGDIAMGSTGFALTANLLQACTISLAEKHLGDPELFSILEKAVPDELQRLNKLKLSPIEYINDEGEKLNLGGTNLLMVGYDHSQQRLRSIYWGWRGEGTDLTPRDCADEILAIGCGKAVDFVKEKLDVTDGLGGPSPWDVVEATKSAIQQAAEAFPNAVGGTIYSHLISCPQLKGIYEDMKNDRREALAAN